MATKQLKSFREFWPFYVSQHMDATCRRLHFVGTTGVIGCVAAAPFFPPALASAPVVGYGFAWLGHFKFEHNVPATFTYPLWSLAADFVMYKKMLTGEMDEELARVQELIDSGQAPWESDVEAELAAT